MRIKEKQPSTALGQAAEGIVVVFLGGGGINMEIKAVDLFCGVGGLTCGLIKVGISVAAGVDVDTSCEYAYTENNDSLFINKSIEDLTGKEVQELLEGARTKILVGCAPCQPFSNHRKDKLNRSSHKDWKLLYQFGRLVKEVHPHIVSMENVPELLKEKVFKDFVQLLEDAGYHVSSSVVNAADYGVPQRRKRLILLASRMDKISLLPGTHARFATVRDVIGDLPPVSAGCPSNKDRLHAAPSLSEKNLDRIRHSVPGGTWHNWPEELVLDCHKTEKGSSYASVYGRMEWDAPSPTITTQFIGYGTGRFGHPEQDRALTLREGALLQTFPPEYNFLAPQSPLTLKNVARHIGNAVPVRLGEVIGMSIKKHLAEQGLIED